VHTVSDGDTLFALSTGRAPAHLGMVVLAVAAAEAVARATVRAVLMARGWRDDHLALHAAGEL